MEFYGCYGEDFKYTNSIVYMGTTLKSGYCLFVDHDEYEDSFHFLWTHGIVYNETTSDIFVYGENMTATYFTELGVTVVDENCTRDTNCVNIKTFPDITPLVMYTCKGNTYLFNKHALPRK